MARLDRVLFLSIWGVLIHQPTAFSFEDTKVLPQGVRTLSLRHIHTDLENKTNAEGVYQNLAAKLNKDLTFKDAINKESGFKKKEIEAFMLRNGFTRTDALGSFSANMTGIVDVTVPLFSYGVTDNLTMAIALPYYRVKSRIEIGFQPSKIASDLVAKLHNPYLNQTNKARETALKLNNAEQELDKKLVKNGYSELGTWEDQGLGDVTIATKYRAVNGSVFRMATTNGFVLPSGQTDDPDILTDIPFGDGTFDFFTQLATDQRMRDGIFFNQYIKYTYQFESQREVRMKTEDEPLEVEKQVVDYQMGQKFEAGLSMQYEPKSGFLFGFGLVGTRKDSDTYDVKSEEVKKELELDTESSASYSEVRVGYSSIPAFQRKETPVPYSLTFDYKKHIASINTPNSDLLTVNMSVFF